MQVRKLSRQRSLSDADAVDAARHSVARDAGTAADASADGIAALALVSGGVPTPAVPDVGLPIPRRGSFSGAGAAAAAGPNRMHRGAVAWTSAYDLNVSPSAMSLVPTSLFSNMPPGLWNPTSVTAAAAAAAPHPVWSTGVVHAAAMHPDAAIAPPFRMQASVPTLPMYVMPGSLPEAASAPAHPVVVSSADVGAISQNRVLFPRPNAAGAAPPGLPPPRTWKFEMEDGRRR